MKQRVVSREYKVMLRKDRFVCPQSDLVERAGEFWTDFAASIQNIVCYANSNFNNVEKTRIIRFYDSVDDRLRNNGYIFRERVDIEAKIREVTLKFRHPDRYISEGRDMSAAQPEKGKTKFEEDIKLPFFTLYSFSTKQQIAYGKKLNKLNDPGELYPDFKKRLKVYQDEEPINVVGGLNAKELVISGADFQIGKNPKVKAECALIAWYDEARERDRPVVVEFSFRYENKKEQYDGEAARRAYEVFSGLERFPEWIDPKGPNKTAYAYSRA